MFFTLHLISTLQETTDADESGISFLRLAAPLLDILRQASTTTEGGEIHPGLWEGWMAVKRAVANAQEK